MKLIYGQAGVVQRQATQVAVRRFVLTAMLLLAVGVVAAMYFRMQSGGFDSLVTAHDPVLESSLLEALDGTMWREDEFRSRALEVAGWESLIVLAPRTRYGHLAELVGCDGLLACDQINRLEGHMAPTDPIRIVALTGNYHLAADIDVSWGTGYRSSTRLRKQGFLVVHRTPRVEARPEEL